MQRRAAAVVAVATATFVAALGPAAPALGLVAPASAGILPALASTALVNRLAPLVNLRPADVPGWQAHAIPAGAGTLSQQATSGSVSALAGCAGTVPLGKLQFAAKMSDIFSSASGHQDLGSLVAALSTPAQMASVLRAEQGQKLLQCLTRVVVPKMTKALPPGAKVSVGHVSVPGMTAQSYGYRVRVDLTEGTTHLQVQDDVLGSVVGRAEAVLTFTAVSGSVPTALEARLLRTVTGRLEAHKALVG